ncbi:MAG TPA: protein phosphatase 2C domain-containing protein [Polyangiaceae bacterium]
MPDPHVLYVVTAVVVLGLVAWVVVVLSRPAGEELGAAGLAPAPGSSKKMASAPPGAASTPSTPPPGDDKPKLDSHAEIRDDPSVNITAEVPVDIEEEEEPTGPNALILVTAVGRTDPGLKRKHNEDAYAILEDHHLFVIADGMGRHAAGEIASQLCVDAISESFKTGDFGPTRQPPLPKRASRLRGSILVGNDRILAAARENDAYAGMGTTVVSAYFSPNNQRVYIAHVGDSRCYRLRSGKFTQLTTDHTLGAAGIQGKSAAVLSRAVGIEENVEVDVSMESPLPGDIYLLCSDGLSRMVKDEEMQVTLEAEKDLEQANRVLIDKANQGGGRDNITAILVRVDDAKLSTSSVTQAAAAAAAAKS